MPGFTANVGTSDTPCPGNHAPIPPPSSSRQSDQLPQHIVHCQVHRRAALSTVSGGQPAAIRAEGRRIINDKLMAGQDDGVKYNRRQTACCILRESAGKKHKKPPSRGQSATMDGRRRHREVSLSLPFKVSYDAPSGHPGLNYLIYPEFPSHYKRFALPCIHIPAHGNLPNYLTTIEKAMLPLYVDMGKPNITI